MGIKSIVKKAAGKAGNAVAKLSSLSPEQLEEIEGKRAAYLAKMPSGNDPMAIELTSRLIAAAGIEIYSAYLPQISRVYVPVEADAEYAGSFDPASNIRFFNITKWVVDSEENSLEKLVNVYDVVSTSISPHISGGLKGRYVGTFLVLNGRTARLQVKSPALRILRICLSLQFRTCQRRNLRSSSARRLKSCSTASCLGLSRRSTP